MLVHDSSTNRLFQKCPVMISLSPSPPPTSTFCFESLHPHFSIVSTKINDRVACMEIALN